MSDLRRLGKRGSYRLGRLAGPPPAHVPPPVPHYPSFAPGRRGPGAVWWLAGLAAAAIVAAGALAGWWFLPFLAGLATGLMARVGRLGLRVSLIAAAVIAAVGWGAALLWADLHGQPVRAVAHEVAALAGLPAHAAVTIAIMLAVAVIQAVAGLWLGRALAPGRSGPG